MTWSIGHRYLGSFKPGPEYMTVVEVCEELGITRRMLLKAESQGKFPAPGRFKANGRRVRVYLPEDVERIRAYFQPVIFERYVNYHNPANKRKREWWQRNKHLLRRQPDDEAAPDDDA